MEDDWKATFVSNDLILDGDLKVTNTLTLLFRFKTTLDDGSIFRTSKSFGSPVVNLWSIVQERLISTMDAWAISLSSSDGSQYLWFSRYSS